MAMTKLLVELAKSEVIGNTAESAVRDSIVSASGPLFSQDLEGQLRAKAVEFAGFEASGL